MVGARPNDKTTYISISRGSFILWSLLDSIPLPFTWINQTNYMLQTHKLSGCLFYSTWGCLNYFHESAQVNSARIAPDQVAADVEKHARRLFQKPFQYDAVLWYNSIYIYIYIHIYIHIYTISTSLCLSLSIYRERHMYIYIHILRYVFSLSLYIYIYMYMYINTHIHNFLAEITGLTVTAIVTVAVAAIIHADS